MKIEPDPEVRSDGPLEIEDAFDRDGYLTLHAGGYDGYVRLNYGQVRQMGMHIAKLIGQRAREGKP
jgi:hypothetical protein